MGRNKKGIFVEKKNVISINFEASVIKALETRSKITGHSVSHIVNFICRRHVMTDEAYFLEMEKFHREQAEGYRWHREQLEIKKEVNGGKIQ